MERRNPTLMASDEILQEIGDIRKSVDAGAKRIHELSRVLHEKARRGEQDDTTGIYIAVSNAWSRFSGMVAQGLSRTASADRLLKLLPTPESKEEAEREAQRQEQRQARRSRKRQSREEAAKSPMDALIELYGSEDVTDAGGR